MSRKILVLGAGKSTSYLLDYFLEKSHSENLRLTIGDINPNAINSKISSHANCDVVALDIFNDEVRMKLIESSSIVVSMLPARLHIKVAKDCIIHKKNLITASYVSDEIMLLDKEVKENGLVFLQ